MVKLKIEEFLGDLIGLFFSFSYIVDWIDLRFIFFIKEIFFV